MRVRIGTLPYCIVFAGLLLPLSPNSLLYGQWVANPGTKAYNEMKRFFETDFPKTKSEAGPGKELSCRIDTIRPRVAFSFRFFSGFIASVPAKQFSGKDNALILLMRVTPESAPENLKYLAYTTDLPPIPDDPGKTFFEFSGGFYAGEGKYKVDIAVTDSKERICRDSWTVSAADRKIPLQLAANTVAPVGLEAWKGLTRNATGGRVTIFMHAIPLYYRRAISKLNPFDRYTLLGSLTSLLDQSQFSKARLVVFDLLGKRVLFKQDDFNPAGYQKLVNTLETASYGTIDIKVLQQGPSDMGMVARLLREESKEKEKSDAIVFLGAEGRPSQHKIPPDLREYDLPSMFYMGFTRFQIPAEDAMYRVVRSTKGKTVTVLRPVDLANGIKSLTQTAAATGSSGN
jgi:hypothetical protein